jgi:hypothetical protein
MIPLGAPDLSGNELTNATAAELAARLRQAGGETPSCFLGTQEQLGLPIAVRVDAAYQAPRP